MDGNFKAEHLQDRKADNQVWLMDGHGFAVSHAEYKDYLSAMPFLLEVSFCQLVVAALHVYSSLLQSDHHAIIIMQ